MAWEWVLPTGSTILGLAGIYAGSWGVSRQVEGARKLAKDERDQRRIESSYSELRDSLVAADEWVLGLLTKVFGGPLQETDRSSRCLYSSLIDLRRRALLRSIGLDVFVNYSVRCGPNFTRFWLSASESK